MVEVLIKKEEESENEYPKIMISEEVVVLFDKYSCGTVLTGSPFRVGNYDNNWKMSEFKDFKGEITIKNK